MRTIVLQSHRSPLPAAWLQDCTGSVRQWAAANGYEYQWLDDSLFEILPDSLRLKTHPQPPIAADLARLRWLEQVLEREFERAVWVDADVLVTRPPALQLPATTHAFGREVWVQKSNGTAKTYSKLHNAFMVFCRGDPVLPFYRFAAESLIARHRSGPMAPQLVGPKLLTALHNLVGFNVLENAAMLPPLVARALMSGVDDAEQLAILKAFTRATSVAPAALNLCGSLLREYTELGINMQDLIHHLRAQPDKLAPELPGTSHT